MLWLEFHTFCFASLQDEICALACDRKPQQHANTNAQVCKTDHARRKLVNVFKNKSDGGEEEVQGTVNDGGVKRHDCDNWAAKQHFGGAYDGKCKTFLV